MKEGEKILQLTAMLPQAVAYTLYCYCDLLLCSSHLFFALLASQFFRFLPECPSYIMLLFRSKGVKCKDDLQKFAIIQDPIVSS